ncbi:MAG: MBL fold metallo-hydrolase [Microgenomates group bacterium]
MDIKYLGHASFSIKSKLGSVVLDPFDSKAVGLKFPTQEADVVTVSHEHDDHNYLSGVTGSPLIVNIPGEYEKNGIRIYGYESYHDANKGADRGKNTLFKIVAEDISVLHCGDLGHMLTEEALEEIDMVDVLMIPVGGFYTISADEAAKIISKIEPSIVIPMHYKTDGHDAETFKDVAPLANFLEKMGAGTIEPVKKLTIKKADLTDQMQIVVMEV